MMSPATKEDVESWFTYHKPVGTQVERYQKIRDAAKSLAFVILESADPSDERDVSLNLLRQLVMWMNAGIAVNERQE